MEDLTTGFSILDAGCGTGKYWPIITSKGYGILGIDQSQKMLDKLKDKFPSACIEKIGLQEINYDNKFLGIICIDAMENVFPEEWLLVLKKFYNALMENGYLYFTVETIDYDEKEYAFKKGIEMGFPIIEGEYTHEGGYHYYPSITKVVEWLNLLNFKIVKQDTSEGYVHFIVRKRPL